ncbi:methyl-branched lipid omega-hydroxylase Cyp124 [Actinomadura kijaniata]|uniref:Cytochrome P450 n=1 Tax=Actinomadura namibiensis TaxID=182080 RepID=A0A7W3LRF8_ACTNM|nr:cytochrome P450 [Actinomadura namibiensis]MBA8952938.1 cytochrome P450 [Actinomadura namibiensis]
MTTPATLRVEDIDISDLRFWQRPRPEREAAFAVLRAAGAPRLFAEPEVPFTRRGDGYWALVRHADVVEASRNPKVFSSEPNATSMVDSPSWLRRYISSMIDMDDPRHAKIRRIVSRAFTPKTLAKTEDDIARRAARIVDELVASGPGDFIPKVAVRLPVEVICDMLGIPDSYYPRVVRLTNIVLGNTDAEYTGITPEMGRLRTGLGLAKVALASRELHAIAAKLGRERVAEPTGDLTSALVNANVDGEKLTTREFGTFFLLLVVAGNETTRTALAHGLKLLTDNPDQRDLLLGDFDTHIAGAVEEIVRCSTPVITFRRNVTEDHEMNGHAYRRGDKVMLFYNSANRDETVFPDPDRFDITRPNVRDHVGFGGPGPHFCLGANLARREITVMFRELFTRLPDLRAAGEPDYLTSSFINGIKRLPCTFTAP